MENYRKDIVWIDWIKTIGMFFVYWCHIGMFGTNKSGLYVPYGFFFVNAFFFISGYLVFKKYYLPSDQDNYFIKNQLNREGWLPSIFYKIAIPTVIFNIIEYIPKTIIDGDGISISGFLFDTVLRGTNWFTGALCISELLLFSLFVFLRKKRIWLFLMVSIPFFLLGNYLSKIQFVIWKDPAFPWFYTSGLMGLLFLVIGGVFYNYEHRIDRLMSHLGGSIFGVVLFVLFCILATIEPFRHATSSALFGYNAPGLFLSLLSIFALILIFKMFPLVKAIKYISRHSIGFFFLSAPLPFVWCKIIEHFLPTGMFSFYIGVIGAFCTAWLFVYIMNRYMPFLFDLRCITINKKQ